MGGLSWFAIPWLCATTMGLAALALENNPAFPTYPGRIPAHEVSAGLVLPHAATALLGKGGAAATLLLVFMAVTSAMSAELIAVSSIVTYDIYQTYIRPTASGKFLIRMSHISCVIYSIIMAAFSTGLYYAGIGLGYIYLMMGCIISSAVLPAALTMIWRDQNWIAAALSPVLGLTCALIAWLVTAKNQCGSLSVACTGGNYPMLAGNVTALLSPIVFVPVLTLVFGRQRYDWVSMAAIKKGDDSDIIHSAALASQHPETGSSMEHTTQASSAEEDAEITHLNRAAKIARTLTVAMTIALLVLWPMPMYGSKYVFSKSFFTGWVTVGIIWIFISLFCVGIFPVWQGRKTCVHTVKSMYRDLTSRGKRRPMMHGQGEDEADAPATPVEKVTDAKAG